MSSCVWSVVIRLFLILCGMILFVTPASAKENECRIADGKAPNTGKCGGPIQRAQLYSLHAREMNSGCQKGEILYYVDNDQTKPKCGKCIPGKSGADDEYHLCALDEYCTDDATCAYIRTHPLYNADCPYEPATSSGSSFCGTGLRCYRHKCLPCLDGMVDYADGKVCVMNVWTYDRWVNVINEPTPTILSVMVVLVLVYGVVSVAIDMAMCCAKRRNKIQRLKRGKGKLGMEENVKMDGQLGSTYTSSATSDQFRLNIQPGTVPPHMSSLKNVLDGKFDSYSGNDLDDYEYEDEDDDEYDDDDDDDDDEDDQTDDDGLPPGAQDTHITRITVHHPRSAVHRPSQTLHLDQHHVRHSRMVGPHRSMSLAPHSSNGKLVPSQQPPPPPPPPPVPPLSLAPSSVDITLAAAKSPRGGVPKSRRQMRDRKSVV